MLNGSCHCKAIKYEASADILAAYHCHCRTCREIHGTVYGTSVMVHKEGFEVTAGRDIMSAYESTPGKKRCFCSKCGSHVFVINQAMPEIVVLRLGNLTPGHGITPTHHFWLSHKEPWYEIRDDLPQSQEM